MISGGEKREMTGEGSGGGKTSRVSTAEVEQTWKNLQESEIQHRRESLPNLPPDYDPSSSSQSRGF